MEDKNSFHFINEKVVKKKKSLKKRIREKGFFCAEALAFGVLAALAFAWIEPKMDFLLHGEETPIIKLPEDTEQEPTQSSTPDTERDPSVNTDEKDTDGTEPTTEPEKVPEYDFAENIKASVVSVIGNRFSDEENETVREATQTSGIVISSEEHTLVLTDYEAIRGSKVISVTFENGIQCAATVIKYDKNLNLAVLNVETGDLFSGEETLQAAAFGSSNQIKLGDSLIYAGVSEGIGTIFSSCQIISEEQELNVGEGIYLLRATNLAANVAQNGFVFNERDQLVGMVTGIRQDKIPNLVAVLGISELKVIIEKLSNGQDLPYLGISGTTVTDEFLQKIHQDMPYGVYITNVSEDSPAYSAGLLRGDIITQISGRNIQTARQLSAVVNSLKVGNKITVVVQRKGKKDYKEITFSVTIEKNQKKQDK